MDWLILGIAPTKDKKEITAAYRQKLRQTNPEDKPEEFKALRAAYEEALALADREETAPEQDESPVGLWIESVKKLYDDFPSRIDPECWKKLLSDDVCIALDTRPKAEEALLKFLWEHFYLPRSVWQLLDQVFCFTQRVEELCEAWPRDFIEHAIVAGTRLEPALDPYLFTPGTNGVDCDKYRDLYFRAGQTEPRALAPILEKMDALSEKHPYGDVLRYRFYTQTGREQEAREGYRRLAEENPNEPSLLTIWADVCLEIGDTDEAERVVSHVLEIAPKHLSALMIHAKCLAKREEFLEAKNCAYEIMRIGGEYPHLQEETAILIKEWNEQLVQRLESRYKEAPEDTANVIELVWCYAQNEREAEAKELATTIDPNYEDAFAYHNLMGKLYHNTGDYEKALPHLQAAEEAIRKMTDDGTKETRKRMSRLPEMLQIQGNCLMQLGKAAEAKEKFEAALELAPEDTEVLSLMGRILFSAGDYTYAVDILERLMKLSPDASFAELLLSMCLYRLHRDREAFDAINHAIAVQGDDLNLYVTKMQILVRNEVFDEVHTLLKYLQDTGAPEDIAIDFIRAQLTEAEEKDAKKALQQYRAIAKRVEAGEVLIWCAELYYHLAVLTGNQTNLQREDSRATVLSLIDKGLAYNHMDSDLLAYKAWVLKKCDLQEDAIAMYLAIEKKDPNSLVALRGLADLYYEDLSLYAREALSYYERILETQKTPELYFYAATCKRLMGDMDGARLYYLKELEMEPHDVDGYCGLATISDARGDYAQSLKHLDCVLALMEEYKRNYDFVIEHKTRVLCRLGRHEDALAFVRDAATRYQYRDSFRLQFNICRQFGLWDKAQEVLSQWSRANRKDPQLMEAKATLNLHLGKMFKAALAMAPAKHKLPADRIEQFRLQLADLECNHQRQLTIWSRRVMQDPTDDHALTMLAFTYMLIGKKDAAKGAAKKALDLLDDALSKNLTDAPLYRSRRTLVLAILGKTKEAAEELAAIRAMPLCDHCQYGSCKDADIYEAAIAELSGDTEAAEKLYTAGKTAWPDEFDFISGLARLKKKGRK